jgi:SAM-dependent methyltransferase
MSGLSVFQKRPCPACASSDARVLFALTPRQFIHPEYDEVAQKRFGVPGDAVFNIVRCRRCSFVFSETEPSSEFAALLYGGADDYTVTAGEHGSLKAWWAGYQLSLAGDLLREIGNTFGHIKPDVLDYGCGYGVLVRALSGPTANCIGYETSPLMLRFLRSEGLAAVEDLTPYCGAFHGIVLSDVLEHLPSPRATLAHIKRMLRPRGFVAINVPNFSERRLRTIEAALKRGAKPPKDVSPWEHLNYFTPTSLREMLVAEGFTPLERDVDIGLRPAPDGGIAHGNGAKSMVRLFGMAVRGRAVPTLTRVIARSS